MFRGQLIQRRPYPLLHLAPRRLGHAYSSHGIGGSLGYAVAPIVSYGLGDILGWRTALLVMGEAIGARLDERPKVGTDAKVKALRDRLDALKDRLK